MAIKLNNIYSIDERKIEGLFRINGTSPFQCPKALQARLFSLPHENFACFLFESMDHLIVSAFERMGDQLWRSFFLGDAFLTSLPMTSALLLDCLEMIFKRLNGASLYFPYIDERSASFSFFKSLSNCLSIQRLPSPIIQWEEKGQLFIDRIGENSKKRACRFWKKFEKALRVNELTGEEALLALDAIEKKSWKHQSQQSMHFRDNQFLFYSDWLRRKGLFMQVAEDEGKPVAYRLDAKLHQTVYTLKYSYNEDYKQFAPGYYLLTRGFYTRWINKGIENIDLWGSPDTLKNSIKTGEYQRHDFLWPTSPSGEKLLGERLAHDKKLVDHLNQNLGLKKIFKAPIKESS